jgi:imidazolonepropionase-like amidohydrolase
MLSKTGAYMKTIYIHAEILDGTEHMQIQHDMSVVVENGRIVSLSCGVPSEISRGTKIVDLSDRYLMPGLINLHVHLPGSGIPKKGAYPNAGKIQKLMRNPLIRAAFRKACEGYAKTELLSGVTTIRTVGGLGHIDSDIRDSINRRKTIGPRMLVSNLAVSVPHGHMAGVLAYEAVTPDECRSYVRKIAEHKPDLIKLMITGGVLDSEVRGEPGILRMQPELVKAGCEEAHKLGFKVAAHVESTEGVKTALENGVDTIEHGAKVTDEILGLYKNRHAADICTLSPAYPLAKLPSELTKLNETAKFNSQVVMDGIIDAAVKCLAAGIPVGLGTDTACPFVTHYDMWRELAYFVKFVGVTPSFALYTATLCNAGIAGIADETGSVEAGKSADFLITDGNPLENFRSLGTPYMVVMRGSQIYRPKIKKSDFVEQQLDSLL